jgi:hypothetical protein
VIAREIIVVIFAIDGKVERVATPWIVVTLEVTNQIVSVSL